MLRGWRRGLFGWVAAGLVWAACSEDETRPELVTDCNDQACLDARENGGPTRLPTGSANTGGAAGGGDGEAGAAGSGMPGVGQTVAGSVREVVEIDPVSTQSVSGRLLVKGPSALIGSRPVEATTDETGAYRLEGVLLDKEVWVGVGAFEDPPIEPFMDTLQAVDTTKAQGDLLVIPRQRMRDLAGESFVQNAVELDPQAAHVIVRFVDEREVPLAGVRLLNPSPLDESVAYDAGGIYTDGVDETSTRGMALIMNLNATAYPGLPLGLAVQISDDGIFDDDDRQFQMAVDIASGSVTVVTAVIPDP